MTEHTMPKLRIRSNATESDIAALIDEMEPVYSEVLTEHGIDEAPKLATMVLAYGQMAGMRVIEDGACMAGANYTGNISDQDQRIFLDTLEQVATKRFMVPGMCR